ncbi:MAG TPA: thiamine pyrophosphate-binding protein [Chloroflexota bacterium]|nr:thiamine pyrophosphate-binding protein [Chloroflexota bacterium]
MGTITGAELLVRALRAEGVDTVFTLVGDHILPIVDAAVDHGIRFVDTRHESAAMHMADGWARATGRTAVCLVTGGPGHANVMPGLAVTYTAESPVVQISGRVEIAQEGLLASQELDQVGMAAPVTKAAWLVRTPERIPQAIATAFRVARSGRPGPVHLTVPLDVQEAQVEDTLAAGLPAAGARRESRALPDPATVEQAVDRLRAATRPVAIIGNAARYSVAPAALQALAESLALPVFTVEQARGLLPDDHPLCFGYADPALNGAARLLRRADVVLLVGKRLDFRIGYGRPPALAAEAQLLQVEADPAEVGRNRAVDLALVGDLGATVEALAAAAHHGPSTPRDAWLDELRAAREQHLVALRALAEDTETPLHPMRVARAVEPFLDADTFLVFDGGDYVQWARSYLAARRPGRWLRLGPLGHLGIGLPLALGCQVAAPDARVVLFIGDGSLGFYFMEFDTAIRHQLPIVAIVGNDATWGIDNAFQLAYYGRAVATTLRPVRYDRLVAELGGHGEHVERAEDLPAALARAFAARRPALVNVAVRRIPSPLAEAMIRRRQAARV